MGTSRIRLIAGLLVAMQSGTAIAVDERISEEEFDKQSAARAALAGTNLGATAGSLFAPLKTARTVSDLIALATDAASLALPAALIAPPDRSLAPKKDWPW